MTVGAAAKTVGAAANAPSLIGKWLAEDVDQWTRRTLRRHFDPVTGSPYWLNRAAAMPFDPRDISRYEELSAFGPFPLEDLRTLDPADLVPLAVPRPLSGLIWESGGTESGSPESGRVYYSPPMLEHRLAWRRWADKREGFDPAGNWLVATPAGAHLLGYGALDLAAARGGRVYGVDFDPRWIDRQLRAGQMQAAMEYTEHVADQICAILMTQPVDYVCTTAVLLRAIARREPGLVTQLKGARLVGPQVTAQTRQVLADAMDGGLVSISYGNAFASAVTLSCTQDTGAIVSVPCYPQVTMAVVDTSDWTRVVDYGNDGQVLLTVMHEDLFLPNVAEQELAIRYDTGEDWPCDGVANVRRLAKASIARQPSAYVQVRLAQLRRDRRKPAAS